MRSYSFPVEFGIEIVIGIIYCKLKILYIKAKNILTQTKNNVYNIEFQPHQALIEILVHFCLNTAQSY